MNANDPGGHGRQKRSGCSEAEQSSGNDTDHTDETPSIAGALPDLYPDGSAAFLDRERRSWHDETEPAAGRREERGE